MAEGAGLVMRRRARPGLGTLVEVRADTADAARFDAAAEAAFAAVAEIHRLMSFHDAASDLRRIGRARVGDRVRVHAHTATVLRRAMRWARLSDGAFDAGCAPRAVAAGWLPAPDDAAWPGESIPGRAVSMSASPSTDLPASTPFEQALSLDGHDVLVHAPAWLDFGGIAKGYAVDRAVAAMRRAGLRAGAVNAGGDLRVFGAQEETVLVRSPFDPAELWPVAALRDAACATSASGAVATRAGAATTATATACSSTPPDADPRAPDDGDVSSPPRSVTVFAPTACAADALTKIVWQQGRRAVALLRQARARAFVVRADGSVWQG